MLTATFTTRSGKLTNGAMTMRCDVIMQRVSITIARHHVGIVSMHCDGRRNSRGGVHDVERAWSRCR